MSDNDVYLFLVDDVWKEIEKQNPKSREEAIKIEKERIDKLIDMEIQKRNERR